MLVTGDETVAGPGHHRPAGQLLDRAHDRLRHHVVAGVKPRQGRASTVARPAGLRRSRARRRGKPPARRRPCCSSRRWRAKAAVLEPSEAGVRKIVCLTEHMPSTT